MILVTELAHLIVRQTLKAGTWTVDATVGNGHDTLLLAELVGPTGQVFGFDIQEAALATAAHRLDGLAHVTLLNCGHERLAECLPAAAKSRLAAVMFNLGYLPGASRDIATGAATTIAALDQSMGYLAIGGLITIIVYPGHGAGADEAAAVKSRADELTAGSGFAVTRCGRINATLPAPELLVIERLR
jgi:predicted methyltransferase